MTVAFANGYDVSADSVRSSKPRLRREMTATERGPGGWPIDPQAAFQEAQGKFHLAQKEAEHWRSNHADLLRRFKVAQTYRGDLVDAATLVRRVVDESDERLSEELRRAINSFLDRVRKTLETEAER
jgi:hypothetical protein